MKLRYLLSLGLSMILCFFVQNAEAQCQRSKTSCTKSAPAERTSIENMKTECTKYSRTYTSCAKNRQSRCGDKGNDNMRSAMPAATLLALGALSNDGENYNFATGLEYTKQLNYHMGLGLLAEVDFAENTQIRFGVPVSFYANKNIKLSAAPLLNMKEMPTIVGQSTSFDNLPEEKTEWDTSAGVRVGVSYMINAGGLILAPTARMDMINKEVLPSFGVNIGLGL